MTDPGAGLPQFVPWPGARPPRPARDRRRTRILLGVAGLGAAVLTLLLVLAGLKVAHFVAAGGNTASKPLDTVVRAVDDVPVPADATPNGHTYTKASFENNAYAQNRWRVPAGTLDGTAIVRDLRGAGYHAVNRTTGRPHDSAWATDTDRDTGDVDVVRSGAPDLMIEVQWADDIIAVTAEG